MRVLRRWLGLLGVPGLGPAARVASFGARPPLSTASIGSDTSMISSSNQTHDIHGWDFDVFQIPADGLPAVVLGFFEDLGLIRDPEHRAAIGSFVAVVQQHYYSKNPYHNFQHCVDVTHATFLMLVGIRAAVSDLECYALLLAALAHDLEHPGVNNAYLIKSKDPLAITYNDLSVLENRHAACLFELVARHPDADVFRDLDVEERELTRKLIIHAIIHTDMCKHFPMVDHIRDWGARVPSAVPDGEERMLFVAAVVLHAADISNPVRGATASVAWARRIMEEFFRQGDLEKVAGHAPSPMCVRAETSLSSVQRNFIGSIVAPLYEAMGELAFLAPPDRNTSSVFRVMHARAIEKLETLYS